MNGRWRKLGPLFEPPEGGLHPKLLSHAANPLPVQLSGDVYRVFYSGRDAANRSSVGAVDVDVQRAAVVDVHREPFFEHGGPGSFFEAGVSIGCLHSVGDRTLMLFMGWQQPAGGHWRGDIGALVVAHDQTLSLESPTPWLASDHTDPVSLSYPWVLPAPEGGWRMWYGSTITWDTGNGEMLHVINGAHSVDGRHWRREGLAVPFQLGRAQAFSRPTVASDGQGGLDTKSLSVTVTDANDAPSGSVSIDNNSPMRGSTLSASNTIVDQDGISSGINYQWLLLDLGW